LEQIQKFGADLKMMHPSSAEPVVVIKQEPQDREEVEALADEAIVGALEDNGDDDTGQAPHNIEVRSM